MGEIKTVLCSYTVFSRQILYKMDVTYFKIKTNHERVIKLIKHQTLFIYLSPQQQQQQLLFKPNKNKTDTHSLDTVLTISFHFD